MRKTLSSLLIITACLCLSAFSHAEVLKVESPSYVESVDVMSLDSSLVEFKNFVNFEPVELALTTNGQISTSYRRQSNFIVANEPVINSYQTLEVGWRYSL